MQVDVAAGSAGQKRALGDVDGTLDDSESQRAGKKQHTFWGGVRDSLGRAEDFDAAAVAGMPLTYQEGLANQDKLMATKTVTELLTVMSECKWPSELKGDNWVHALSSPPLEALAQAFQRRQPTDPERRILLHFDVNDYFDAQAMLVEFTCQVIKAGDVNALEFIMERGAPVVALGQMSIDAAWASSTVAMYQRIHDLVKLPYQTTQETYALVEHPEVARHVLAPPASSNRSQQTEYWVQEVYNTRLRWVFRTLYAYKRHTELVPMLATLVSLGLSLDEVAGRSYSVNVLRGLLNPPYNLRFNPQQLVCWLRTAVNNDKLLDAEYVLSLGAHPVNSVGVPKSRAMYELLRTRYGWVLPRHQHTDMFRVIVGEVDLEWFHLFVALEPNIDPECARVIFQQAKTRCIVSANTRNRNKVFCTMLRGLVDAGVEPLPDLRERHRGKKGITNLWKAAFGPQRHSPIPIEARPVAPPPPVPVGPQLALFDDDVDNDQPMPQAQVEALIRRELAAQREPVVVADSDTDSE